LPLSEKARIEVFLPDLPKRSYQELLQALNREFTYTFGGATILRGLDGSYLSRAGTMVGDRINVVFTDTPLAFDAHFESLSRYCDEVRNAAFEALEEEAVLIVVMEVYHAE